MKSQLDLGCEAQPRNHPRLRLAILGTMQSVFDSAGHRVPRTKPTCLLHTWRPHQPRPFALFLHLHQHQSNHNLHLQYLAKSQSTPRCQSLITPGSDHPLVLEPHAKSVLTLFPDEHTSVLDCTVVKNHLIEVPCRGRSNRLGGQSNRLG
jgi:hypothetical protein